MKCTTWPVTRTGQKAVWDNFDTSFKIRKNVIFDHVCMIERVVWRSIQLKVSTMMVSVPEHSWIWASQDCNRSDWWSRDVLQTGHRCRVWRSDILISSQALAHSLRIMRLSWIVVVSHLHSSYWEMSPHTKEDSSERPHEDKVVLGYILTWLANTVVCLHNGHIKAIELWMCFERDSPFALSGSHSHTTSQCSCFQYIK